MKGTGLRVISEWTDALKEASGDSLKALLSGWLRILEKPLLVILFLMLLSHWLI